MPNSSDPHANESAGPDGSPESTSYAARITGDNDPKNPDGLITLEDLAPQEDLAAGSTPLSRLNPPGNRLPPVEE